MNINIKKVLAFICVGTYIVTTMEATELKQKKLRTHTEETHTLESAEQPIALLSSDTARVSSTEDKDRILFTPFCLGLFIGCQYPSTAKNTNVALGLFTTSQDRINGIQVTTLYGNIEKGFDGVQASGCINTLDGYGKGVQISGIMNIVSGNIKGVQGTLFMNIADGNLQGVQASGFMNVISGDVKGIQGTLFMNISDGNLQGVQGSGFMNVISGDVKGIQGAGFMNVAQKVDGVQAAAINVAEENNGIAIGLLNIIGNGIISPAVYIEHNQVFVQYQGGTKMLFTTILVGCPTDRDYTVYGAGFGTRIGKKALSGDMELLYKQIDDSDLDNAFDLWKDNSYPSVRISANFMFLKHLGLFIAYNADFEANGWNEHAFTYWDHGVSQHFSIGDTNCTAYSYGTIGIKF